eukprot:6194783-Pleurochrysis_carterae.AAC.1
MARSLFIESTFNEGQWLDQFAVANLVCSLWLCCIHSPLGLALQSLLYVVRLYLRQRPMYLRGDALK